MKEHYVGDYPAHIPMMPEKVEIEVFKEKYEFDNLIKNEQILPIGLEFEEVKPVGIKLDSTNLFTSSKPSFKSYDILIIITIKIILIL